MASRVKRSGGARLLKKVIAAFEKGMDQAVVAVALRIERQSVREVPVDFDRLRTSRKVDLDRSRGRGMVKASISYGTDYALFVHERLDVHHKAPTKAKYLIDPYNNHAPRLKDEIKKRTRKNVRGVLDRVQKAKR